MLSTTPNGIEVRCWATLLPDRMKRKLIIDDPPFSLLAHTSVEFGEEHAEEDEKIVGEQIKEELFKFLPNLPRDTSYAKYHKWKHCQVIG